MATIGHDERSSAHLGSTDEQAVMRARLGDDWATDRLVRRYRSLVERHARTYFLEGAEQEDVFQEGMMGLWKAIQDFRSDRLPHFAPFAELCVTRQILSAIKASKRHKHIPLNGYVSLDKPISDGSGATLLRDTIRDTAATPEEALLHEPDEEPNLGEFNAELTELEMQVIERYLNAQSYHDIARDLTCGTKSVDNALQRAKKKLKKLRL